MRGCDKGKERDKVRRALGVARFRSRRRKTSQSRSAGLSTDGMRLLEQCPAGWRAGATCRDVGGHSLGAGAGGQLWGQS